VPAAAGVGGGGSSTAKKTSRSRVAGGGDGEAAGNKVGGVEGILGDERVRGLEKEATGAYGLSVARLLSHIYVYKFI